MSDDGNVVRGFHPDFEEKIVHLVAGNKNFYNNYRSVILPELFTVDNFRHIVRVVADYTLKYGKHPCLETIRELVRRSDYRDRDGVLTVLSQVNGYDDTGFVGDELISRARWTAIDRALLQDHTPETLADEIRKAASIGALAGDQSITTLDEDDVVTGGIRNQIIPTPWTWLNEQLMGGPEKQDLAVVLSVINGGKTTMLVNIAHSCIQDGLVVVYFTFEDGHKKIKRRMRQRIAGMTFEEILANQDRMKAKCARFSEMYTGKLFIKTLASRKDTVADAASIIRHLPQKPDVIITDYADRFRPKQQHKEPRHMLREIFEDCKQLAKDADVLHWSARQVSKDRVGKNIVGIEHAGESWGTMESPDLVVGIGRSLEDERLGRITLYTAKVRDHGGHKSCPLMADFDRQRIWDVNS